MAICKPSGFTLLELIASLVLLGIMAAATGKAILIVAELYNESESNLAVSQKAQIALLRLTREFRELTQVVATGDTPWVIYDKLDGRHAVAFVDHYIKLYDLPIGQESLSADHLQSNGHVLVDRVDTFELAYHAGNLSDSPSEVNRWTTDNPLEDLSAISIKLSLNGTSESRRPFSFGTLIHPRNINSHGGAIPSDHLYPPTIDQYCFITSAAAPFQFKSLLKVVLIFWGSLQGVNRWRRWWGRILYGCLDPCSGSALIWVVMILTFFSVLATAIFPLITTSQTQQVVGIYSEQANLLAESGYRYAASRYLNAPTEADKNDVLAQLHHQTFQLEDHSGEFRLEVWPYFFDITAANINNTLSVRIPGGVADALAENLHTLSRVQIGADIFNCNVDWIASNSTGRLTLAGSVPAFQAGTTVLLAAQSDSTPQHFVNGGSLALLNDSGDSFPDHNGEVMINHRIFTYRQNDRNNNQLLGLSDPTDPAGSFEIVVDANSDVVLNKYIDLETIGVAGSGDMQTPRRLVYHTPLPSTEPVEQGRQWHDNFDSLEHWRSRWGEHQSGLMDNDSALRVTGTSNQIKFYPNASLIEIDWSSLPINIEDIQSISNGYRNYTAQVKIGFEETVPQPNWGYDPGSPIPKYYGAGLLFRLDENQNAYGLSFLRGNQLRGWPHDEMDNRLVPEDNAHLLVLWQATGDGLNRSWLAYKRLDAFFDDMENPFDANWQAELNSPWAIIDNAFNLFTLPIVSHYDSMVNSPTRSLHNVELFNYSNNSNTSIHSRSIPIMSPCQVQLKFAQFYQIAAGDYGRVELSTDGAETWGEPIYQINPGYLQNWQPVMLDLGSFPSPTDLQIRFRLVSDFFLTAEGWFIDDVALVTLPMQHATLAVQISEAATLSFTGAGPGEFQMGSVVSGHNGSGRVVEPPLLTSSDWSGGNASGWLRLEMISGTFVPQEQISAGGATETTATVQMFRERENFIRAYYGSESSCGSGDGDPFNLYRQANQRVTLSSSQTQLNWPPAPHETWSAETDHFIQIQWDKVNDAIVNPYGTASIIGMNALSEANAVIRSWNNTLLLPSESSMPTNIRPEIGLHSFGSGAENIYFDDFGMCSTRRTYRGTVTPPLVE